MLHVRTLVGVGEDVDLTITGCLVSCCGEAWLGIHTRYIPHTHSPAPGSCTWHQVVTHIRLLSVQPQPFPLPHLQPPTDLCFFTNFHMIRFQFSTSAVRSVVLKNLFIFRLWFKSTKYRLSTSSTFSMAVFTVCLTCFLIFVADSSQEETMTMVNIANILPL